MTSPVVALELTTCLLHQLLPEYKRRIMHLHLDRLPGRENQLLLTRLQHMCNTRVIQLLQFSTRLPRQTCTRYFHNQ